MNRTLIEMARCMILSSGISPSFWAEAVATACYLRNRCPTSSLNGEIPYEKWFERPVNVKYLKTFGTKVHVLEKEPGKDKFAARSSLGIFVGYPPDSKGYNIWIPESRRIVVSRDVKFQEGKLTETECKVSNESLIEPQCEKSVVRKTVDIEIQTKEQSDVPFSDEPSREDIPLDIQPNVPVIDEGSTDNTESTGIGDRNVILEARPGRPRIQKGHVGRPRKIYL